jgi:hypothetical protein
MPAIFYRQTLLDNIDEWRFTTHLILEFDVCDRYGSEYISGKQWVIKEILGGFSNQQATIVLDREKMINEISRIMHNHE